MPNVAIVTPTVATTSTIAAFTGALAGNITYTPYSAGEHNGNLDGMAQSAIASNPTAILACGSMAVAKLINHNAQCPIVMVGGLAPQYPPSNLMGYVLNGVGIAQYQIDNLLSRFNANKIALLYDNTNDPSIYIYNQLDFDPNKVKPYPISDPGLFATQNITEDAFMLIPNATYYNHRQDLIKMVDYNNNVKTIYYPEADYKNISGNKGKVKVHGHDVLHTFANAAGIVNSYVQTGALPQPLLVEATKFKDD